MSFLNSIYLIVGGFVAGFLIGKYPKQFSDGIKVFIKNIKKIEKRLNK